MQNAKQEHDWAQTGILKYPSSLECDAPVGEGRGAREKAENAIQGCPGLLVMAKEHRPVAQTTEIDCLTIPEAGMPRSRCQRAGSF